MSVAGREAVAAPARRLGRTCVTVCLALSAALYSAWVLQFPLHLGIDPVHAYASELAAATRPRHRLFISTDLAAGLLAGAAAAIMLLTRRPQSLAPRTAWLALAGFGSATAVDSLLPLPCAPHSDAGCAAREATHQLPITNALHLVSSTAAIAGLLVALVCFTIATKRGTIAHRTGVAISLVSVASTLWTIAEVVVDDSTPTYEHVGLAQRIQLGALAVGVAYIASLSWTDWRRQARRGVSPPRPPTTGGDAVLRCPRTRRYSDWSSASPSAPVRPAAARSTVTAESSYAAGASSHAFRPASDIEVNPRDRL